MGLAIGRDKQQGAPRRTDLKQEGLYQERVVSVG